MMDRETNERLLLRAYEYEAQLRAEGRPNARAIARAAYGLEAAPQDEREPDEMIAAMPPTPREVRDAMVVHYATAHTPQGEPKGEHARQQHRRSHANRRAQQPPRDPARIELRGGARKPRPGSRWGWTGGLS